MKKQEEKGLVSKHIYTTKDEEFWIRAAKIEELKNEEAFRKLTFIEKVKAKRADIGVFFMIILFVFLAITDAHSGEIQANIFEAVKVEKIIKQATSKKEEIDINKIKVLSIPRWCDKSIILDYKIAQKLEEVKKQFQYTKEIWNGLNDLEKKEAYQVLKNHSFQSEDYPNIRYLCVLVEK